MNYGSYGDFNYYGNSSSFDFSDIGIWTIIAFVIAIIGGICLYFTVFSDSNDGKYNGFMAKLYDFVKFKKMYLTVILKITYLILTIFISLISLRLINISFLSFVCILFFGNLSLRIFYEFMLVLLSIHENTTEIRKKIKKL